MKVKTQHIKEGLKKWYVGELSPLKKDFWLGIPWLILYLNGYERKYKTHIEMVLDENGEIEIDEIHKEYVDLMEQQGGTVEVLGFTITGRKELDKLLDYIKNAVPKPLT